MKIDGRHPPDSRIAAESCPDSEEHRAWGESLKRKRGNQKFDGGALRIRSRECLLALDFFDFCQADKVFNDHIHQHFTPKFFDDL